MKYSQRINKTTDTTKSKVLTNNYENNYKDLTSLNVNEPILENTIDNNQNSKIRTCGGTSEILTHNNHREVHIDDVCNNNGGGKIIDNIPIIRSYCMEWAPYHGTSTAKRPIHKYTRVRSYKWQ